jgi:hypothetical protein
MVMRLSALRAGRALPRRFLVLKDLEGSDKLENAVTSTHSTEFCNCCITEQEISTPPGKLKVNYTCLYPEDGISKPA